VAQPLTVPANDIALSCIKNKAKCNIKSHWWIYAKPAYLQKVLRNFHIFTQIVLISQYQPVQPRIWYYTNYSIFIIIIMKMNYWWWYEPRDQLTCNGVPVSRIRCGAV